MNKGILYGVGVGPGDPELITVKALNIIKNNDIIAVPGSSKEESAAYLIAQKAVPDLAQKTVFTLSMPMTRDRADLLKRHEKIADELKKRLDNGENVVFLTLGDPGIYSTFSYIRAILQEEGYEVVTIPGITSFSAVAARLGISLADWDEEVHIIPAGQRETFEMAEKGTCIFMKPKGGMIPFKEALRTAKRDVYAISDCGLESEMIYRGLDNIPDETGYMTLFIVK